MQYNRLTDPNALLNLIKALDKRVSGVETRGTGVIGFVGSDGVELSIGVQPDGQAAIVPFVGDTTPPPVATSPDASAGPGFLTVTWDGLFVNGETMPLDFEHLNVLGRRIVNGVPDLTVSVGIIRNPMDSCLVGTEVAAVGETWEFLFVSEDYNGNLSAVSATSNQVTQKSFAADVLIDDALSGLQQNFISAQSAAASAQQAANNAQQSADDADAAALQAAGIANSKGKVITSPSAPAVADQNANNLWIDTTNGANTPKRWNGSAWVAVTDKVATDAAAAVIVAQTKADQAFNNAATAAAAAGNAQTTADSKNRSWYQPDQPAGTAHKVGDNWFDTDDGFKLRTWNGTIWQTTQDSALAQQTADSKGKTFTQAVAPPVSERLPQNTWIDISLGADQAVTKYWDTTSGAWLSVSEKAAKDAQTTADAKGETIYSSTAPPASKQLPQNTWIDTTGGLNLQKRWVTGSGWVVVVDSRIPSTAAAVTAVDSRVTTVSATADSKGITYTQNTVPPVSARLPQNIWIDTSLGLDKAVTKYWDGAAWTAVSEKAASDAKAVADSKGETIYSSTAPAASKQLPQNLWVDTTGGINITKRWDTTSGTWVVSADSRIASTAAAVTAVDARVTTVSANVNVVSQSVQDVQTFAATNGVTLTQNTVPSAAFQNSTTIWNDTSLGLNNVVTKYWNGTTWTALSDKAATDAQSTANAKGETIYSSTTPDASKQLPQNTWVDTTGGLNMVKRWDGSGWVVTVDSRIPSTAAAVTAVDSRVTGVSSAASAAVATVDSKVTSVSAAASAAVNTVDSKVIAVSAVADSKGEIIYSSTTPPVSKQLPQNQWVDTTGGINIVKRWNTGTGTWVVASDQRIDTNAAAVTAVDSRVTSVSAAASGQITSVDSRVTGVSAAAGSAITNVDTRVTGVSAAASSEATAKANAAQAAAIAAAALDATAKADAAKAAADRAAMQTVNKLVNPSFEPDFTNWTQGRAVLDTTTQRSGANSARIDGGTGTRMSPIPLTIPVVAGQRWRIGVWYKTTADYNGTAGNGKLRWGNQTDAHIQSATFLANQTNWTWIEIERVIAAGETAISPSLNADHTVGKIWFDEIEVRDVTELRALEAAATQAKTDAIAAAALDASTKATNAQTAAITAAATDATNKVTVVDSKVSSVSAAVTSVDSRVTGVSAAAGSAISTVDTRVTGVSSAAGSAITNVDTRVTGVSAAASSGISTVDTRVTSVSAAASGQISTVDSRVTGVSAAAGTAIGNVDTRVTGVSAAAGTAIANVDTRVTGVSSAANTAISTVDTRVTGVSAAAAAAADKAESDAISAQAYSLNASFDDWTGTFPTGYTNWVGTPVKETSITKRPPFAMRFNAPDAVAMHGVAFSSIVNHAPNLEFFTIEVDFYLVSGILDGSGVILDWTGMTNNRSLINFATEVPGALTGKWYRVSKVLRRPTNATGTWTNMSGYLMASWTGFGSALAAKNIIFDWFNVRPSTFEEILSYKAPTTQDLTNVDTRVTGVSAAASSQIGTVDTRVTGVSAAAGTAITNVDTKVTGVSAAAATQITNVDTRVTGVSSAAGSAITNVDTRVTGVSAAAGTAIGTVDSRVTGVSSAAGTAITNVDTKVTGVSAAASTAITNVDTKVTSVSAAASGQINTIDSRVTGVSAAATTQIGTVDSRVTGVSAAASSEATSKANAAQAAAISAAATDASAKVDVVDTKVVSVSAAVTSVDSRVTGVSAAAGSAITNVDTRVTGVSAAAGSAITNVDTRVTGVSAAAGTAITNVDTRVTGVSAAAGTAISNVDARVTGVSAAAAASFVSNQAEIDQIWSSSRSYINNATTATDIQVMQGVIPTVVTSVSAMGGKAVQKSGTGNGWWHDNRAKQVYDPSALYRMTLRVRTVTAATTGGKGLYWGFAGLAADGTTFVNAAGANSYSSQQWAYSNIQIPTDGGWVDYVAYYRGLSSSTPSGAGTSVLQPRLMHADTRYVVPSMIIDYNNGNGVWEISHWSIDVVDAAGYAGLVDAANKSVTYYDPNMPTGGVYKKGDLWIDTDDGNKIYAHNGTTFVSAQDTAISSAATSASAAMTAANGKNKIVYSTSVAPAPAGYAAGDTWFQKDASNIIIGQWEHNGSAWLAKTLDNAVIANLNAAKLTAGTIAAGRIGASTISADKLIVGDMTNLAADGNFQDATKLNWVGSGTVTASAGQANMLKIITAASGNNDQANRNSFQVTGGEQLYGEMWVYGDPANVGAGGPNLHVAVAMLDGTTQWPTFANATRAAVSGQWVKLSGSVTIPANAKSAKVEPAVSFSADAVGNTYYIRDVVVRRKASGSLIVDGAIQAGSAIIGTGAIGNAQIADLNAAKINAGTLDAQRLNAEDIRAKIIAATKINAIDVIASGSISSSTGVFGVLDASSINAGTIGAARLNATDIQAKMIAAGKVNAIDIIATGSISSSTGLFGDINASSITSGTLSAARIGAGSITASALSVTMGGNNLVANSSFEVDSNGDGLADGWNTWARGAGDAGRVFTNTLVPGMFPGSTFAQRVTSTTVTNTEQSSIQASQLFAINAGDKVTLSLYIRASIAGSFSVSMRCEDAVGTYKGDANFMAPVDTTAQRFYSVVTIPAGTTRAKVTITTPASLSNGHWFEVDGIKAELGDMVSAWSPMTAELLPGTINATMLTATAIDGKTITGSTIQTEATANRGIKLTTAELAGYDGAGVKNFSLTSGGTLALRGALQSGSSIQGASVSASGIYTNPAVNTGIKITDTGIKAYNAGSLTFNLDATTGMLEVPGLKANSVTGGMISGTAIDGKTITGATVQTETTASRGIKLTSTELAGYDGAGVKSFSLASDGSLSLKGNILSGSTITGATLAAAGGGIVTTTASNRGVKLQDTGITTYDSVGNLTFKVDAATGLVEAPGLKAGSISSAMISATAIDGKTITGATIQTDNTPIGTSASRGIKLTTAELAGYDGTGTKNFSLASDGTLTIRGAIQSGSTITGATLTGTGIETTATASRGVKIASSGITAYDTSGNMTFKVDAATGLVEAPGIKANSISSTMLAATAIDGMVITGPTIQTTQTALRGIKLTSTEFAGYDNSGIKNFSLTSAGVLTIKGDITSGSTVTGATVTGGTVQSEATASRGIKMTSTELAGYDTVGTKNFSLTSAGALFLVGQIKSGSTIEAATLSAGGGGIQTNPAALRGVKITDTGIKAYDGSGNLTFQVDGTTGVIDAPGLRANSITSTMVAATAIDGKTITGPTIQTEQTANRGIKLTTSELAGWDGTGQKNFSLTSAGALTIRGELLSGSSITGASLTAGGGGIYTSASANTGVKITDAGIKAYGGGSLTFHLDATTGFLEVPGLKANSINGDRIVAGSIGGDRITAGAITTKHLTVGDFTNLATIDELNGTTITSYGQTQIVSGYNKLVTDSGAFFMFTEKKGPIPFKLGDKIRYEFIAKATAATTANFAVYTYDAADANSVSTTAAFNIGTTDTPISGVLDIANSNMATAQKFVLGLINVANKGIQVKNVRVIRQSDATTIADGAITTAKITSSGIDAGAITAGTLTSTQIKSKSITVDDLVVSSTDNLVVEADFGNNGTSWGLGASVVINATAGRGSLPAMRVWGTTTKQTSLNLNNKFTVDSDARFRGNLWVKSTAALAADKVQLLFRPYINGTAQTDVVVATNVALAANTWTLVSGMSPVLPAGTNYGEILIAVTNDNTATLTDIDYVSITRAMNGNLIVDGSITAASVAASAIGAQHLMANSITASALNTSQLWSDSSWLGTAGASSLKLSTSTLPVSSMAVSGSVSAVYWNKVSSEVNANGIRVFNTTTDANGAFVDEDPIIQLGTFTDDYFQINSGDSATLINMDNSGTITANAIEANEIRYQGDTLARYLDSKSTRGMVAWGQVPITTSMAVAGGSEVGLFEIAWDAQDADDVTKDDQLNLARMYQFNLNDFLINTGGAGQYGLRLRYTTNDTAPTITSSLLGFKYFRTDVAGLMGTGSFTRIIGSNNGAKLRVLVTLYSSGSNANVYTGTGQTHLYSTVVDLGTSMPPAAVASTGGGTPYNGAPTVPPPTNPKVTRTVEYGYYGSRSFLPSGAAYNYNVSKAYQGLSPAGYGNLSSQYTFNQNFQTLLTNATVNDIWVYLYFEHWYNNAGGTAKIRLHNNLQTPATNVGMTANGVDSGSWPKGAGRWVRIPTSLYAGFQSGAYKGFGLVGDGTYNTYGIANNARIRIRYTV